VTHKGMTGGCLCGAVRYEISADPVVAGHCHCIDCRKASGAPHASFAGFPATAVKLTGATKTYKTKAESGMMSARSFCPECGSWVTGHPESVPGVIAITIATLDDPELIKPQLRLFDKRRISWDSVDSSLPSFPSMPPHPGSP
jgi:hypothetical protein